MAADARTIALLLVFFLSNQPISSRSLPPPQQTPETRDAEKPVSSAMLHIGPQTIQVDFAAGSLDASREEVLRWIDTAARAVAVYYGRFPVSGAHVLVAPRKGVRGVLQGTTWGDLDGFPAFTRMILGEHTTPEDLRDDWTMTHEFVHVALPSLADQHHWLEEGIATYVEPIARVQAGFLPPQKIWADMVRDMPKGEPDATDRGLDRTHTWGSTYWGGALFCLRADVAIRKETANRRGLQDALRGIVAAGGTIAVDWPIERVLETGDAATGTTVLMDLYRKMASAPTLTGLDAMWRELGIRTDQSPVAFDPHAPFAAVRTAITAHPKNE